MKVTLDPIKYEIFRHRLFNILEEGRVAIKMVSGSPVVVEGGETMCCFCNTSGDPILVAAGILLHAIGARDFIKKAIEWYSEDPGFNDGDQLFFNDPYIGGQHTCDQVIIKPIFYKGKIVAWAGSIMHTVEIGGMDPSGLQFRATDIYQEGFRFVGLKIVEKGKLRKEVYNTLLQFARDRHLLALDTRAKIAANNTCARGYLQLIENFGIDFVEAASARLIEEAEKLAKAKLKRLPDGIWRSRAYGDSTGIQEDKPYRVVCTMTKKGDTVVFNFDGSSPQNENSVNCTLPATWGQLFISLTSQLFWDVPWNAGMLAPVKVIAPEGTLVNCRFPAACSRGVMTSGTLIQQVAHECIAKMLYAGGLYEDVNSAWKGPTAAGPTFGGINQFGDPCSGATLDNFAGGLGATPFRDGVDSGADMMNPQSCISDVELNEQNIPWVYLKRNHIADSGGFGKFSGGVTPESIFMVYGTNNLRAGMSRHSARAPGNWGMFGGYPTSLIEGFFVLNPKVKELLFEQSKVPLCFEDAEQLGGQVIDPPVASIPHRPVKQYDLVFNRYGGGGGYGDPLERDPARVLADVKRGVVSLDTAARIYGVVIDPERMALDSDRTTKTRSSIIEHRLMEGKMTRKPDASNATINKTNSLMRIHEYLDIVEIGGQKAIQCRKCGYVFCDAHKNYKEYALSREVDLADVKLRSLMHGHPIWVLYQEYICPKCGVLLEVDNFCPTLDSEEEKVLWDIQIEV